MINNKPEPESRVTPSLCSLFMISVSDDNILNKSNMHLGVSTHGLTNFRCESPKGLLFCLKLTLQFNVASFS